MTDLSKVLVILFYLKCFSCLSLRKDQSIVDSKVIAAVNDDCDPSTIPIMDSFDMKKFSGKWFELAKTATGYIDVADGVWLIEGSNVSHNFLFSGRDNNHHCIRPIKGKMSSSQETPGLLTLNYKTYSTHVEEQIRVVFTDYSSVAVIYSCMHHVHTDKEVCHSAGLFGAIWTRMPHVDVEIYEKAITYLELACVHKSSLIIRNLVGPCRVDNWDFRIDDFPAPDYCYQALELGNCNSNVQRFYYDAKEKKCKQFTFNGCKGNQNNFMSFSECQKKCTVASNKEPVCMSIAKCALHCSPCCTEDRNGCVKCDCEHIIEDNFLNCVKSPSMCPDECEVENLYPGCHVCRCGGIIKLDNEMSVCNEVKAVGNCKENIQRYYYNAINEECEKFLYSGCDGNNNNFQTLQECREKCKADNTEVFESPQLIEEPSNSFLQKPSALLIIITTLLIKFYYLNSYK